MAPGAGHAVQEDRDLRRLRKGQELLPDLPARLAVWLADSGQGHGPERPEQGADERHQPRVLCPKQYVLVFSDCSCPDTSSSTTDSLAGSPLQSRKSRQKASRARSSSARPTVQAANCSRGWPGTTRRTSGIDHTSVRSTPRVPATAAMHAPTDTSCRSRTSSVTRTSRTDVSFTRLPLKPWDRAS